MIKLKRLIIVTIILIVAFLFCWFENKYLSVTHYSFDRKEVTEDFDGFRIVQISDLHNASFGVGNKRLIRKIEKLVPDIIVITGDLVDSKHTNIDVVTSFAETIISISPVYYVTGNHENWLDAEEKKGLIDKLTELGVICLENESVEITKGESSFSLIGLNDENLSDRTLSNIVKDLKREQLQILLAHEPQYIKNYSLSNVDLVLSGHAHGGQFRIPFIGGVIAPDQGIFPEYTEGKHVYGETSMIISRGLGNSIIPLRVLNLPEIVCVDLKSK